MTALMKLFLASFAYFVKRVCFACLGFRVVAFHRQPRDRKMSNCFGAGGARKYPRSRFGATSAHHPGELALGFLNSSPMPICWHKDRGFLIGWKISAQDDRRHPVSEDSLRHAIWRWVHRRIGIELSDFETEQVLSAASFWGLAQ